MAATFFLMILVFYTYDWFVQRRNKKLLMNAARSNEIVSSMFPGQLRDKIVNTTPDDPRQNLLSPWSKRVNDALSNHSRHGQEGKTIAFDSPPLAELHPEATVLFADIVGFTAWSSVREPTQVFRLLETVYSAFDDLARCRGVFKVETVGMSSEEEFPNNCMLYVLSKAFSSNPQETVTSQHVACQTGKRIMLVSHVSCCTCFGE